MVNGFGFSGGAVNRVRLIVFTTVLLSALSMSGCSCDVLPLPGGAIEKAVRVIDNGIRDILENMDIWSEVLQRVANELPREISETIRVDAQNLAERSIAKAGIEFSCRFDFLANRAIESLRRLKAELLGQNPPDLPPTFCQVPRDSIDLKVSPAKWPTAILGGYDLDHKDSAGKLTKVLLLTEQGSTIPLPESRIGRTTHYQITLNLGKLARELYLNRVTKIVVSWNDEILDQGQIVIVPWEATPPQTFRINIGSTGPYYPDHIGGDRDFDTHDDEPTYLEVRGKMSVTEYAIYNCIYMWAREAEHDYTEVEGWSDWGRAYTPPKGWRIVDVRPDVTSIHEAVVTGCGCITLDRPAGEVVSYFEVCVDRDGEEAGTWSNVIAHWRPLNITIEEVMPEWLR